MKFEQLWIFGIPLPASTSLLHLRQRNIHWANFLSPGVRCPSSPSLNNYLVSNDNIFVEISINAAKESRPGLA